MSNLAAAAARPQLGAALADRCRRWNERYRWLSTALAGMAHLRLPVRPPEEGFVASSLQFSLVGLAPDACRAVIAACGARGVHIKWFGAAEPAGFTSAWQHWRFFPDQQHLPNAERVLAGLCDLRLPLTLTAADCSAIAEVVRDAIRAAVPAA
jgi:dTDP-4-amino-4,6-dideoxygalactose transaminase